MYETCLRVASSASTAADNQICTGVAPQGCVLQDHQYNLVKIPVPKQMRKNTRKTNGVVSKGDLSIFSPGHGSTIAFLKIACSLPWTPDGSGVRGCFWFAFAFVFLIPCLHLFAPFIRVASGPRQHQPRFQKCLLRNQKKLARL